MVRIGRSACLLLGSWWLVACSIFTSLDGLAGDDQDVPDAFVDATTSDVVERDATTEEATEASADANDACAPRSGDLAFYEAETKIVDLSFGAKDAGSGPTLAPGNGTNDCPVMLGNGSLPQRVVIVLNATGREASLEAWGTCGGGPGISYLSLATYLRDTPPTTPAELTACTNVSARFVGNDNPAGGEYCGGLYETNGQATKMPACSRAAIVFQGSVEDPFIDSVAAAIRLR